MTLAKLESLADKVESLGGPDRAIDWQIHLRDGLDGVGMYGDHPAYTGSLDAAMTLVPEGCWLSWLGQDRPDAAFGCILGTGPDGAAVNGHAATPAIALCAAALRARKDQP